MQSNGISGNKRKRDESEAIENKKFKNNRECWKKIDLSIGRALRSKIKIDLESTEIMTQKKFKDLILARESQGVPFVLAMAKIEGSLDLHPYDGSAIYRHLKNDISSPLSNEKIESVFYFTITSLNKKCFEPLIEIKIANKNKNENEFLSEFFLACNENNTTSQVNVGLKYLIGNGIPKNDLKALFFLKLAANQGDVPAQLQLGNCYNYGRGVQIDWKKAVGFYTLAANQGYAPAQLQLGHCYKYGIEVDADVAKAMHLYLLAASQENFIAKSYIKKDLATHLEEELGWGT
jgi:hypothetical protein